MSGFHWVIRPLVFLASIVLATGTGTIATAGQCTSSDLGEQWSETSNPSGPWSYRDGATPLPHVDSWQSGIGGWTEAQPAWSHVENGPRRIPMWLRSNGTETFEHDFRRGDIVTHTQDDFSGVGNGISTLVWTAPADETISIRGGVWMGRRIGRANDWRLYRNDVLLTQGSLASGDGYSRSEPFSFRDGSGGTAAVTGVAVSQGDEIRLEIERTSEYGDFVGVKMKVVCSQASAAGNSAAPRIHVQPRR